MLRCAAPMSSTRAGVISSARRRPTASPYWCLTRSRVSCRIAAESGIEYLLGMTQLWRSFHARPEAADDADWFPACSHAQRQAGRQRERLAPPDRPAAEGALDESGAGSHDRDREAPVADLDL